MDILEASAVFGRGAMQGAIDCYICARPTGTALKPPNICVVCVKRLAKEGFGPRLGYDEDRPTESQHPADTNSTIVLTAFEREPERTSTARKSSTWPPAGMVAVPSKVIPGAVWVRPAPPQSAGPAPSLVPVLP